ncbi:homeodomain-like superfamily protein [Actinidia rufa]|uniref:Homeodomain-like superfamily protein n=1 Tax=Actinidia rufa TaxID=165716 RepID=A0A7J0F382_9ERIC|nr:homeodomain-like superfamily protein [Actinidia rufa]
MEGHHPHIAVNVDAGDRFPQWSVQETRDFLMIRAELDPTFMETKRNKLLWEVIATKMKDKGYNRSAEQCKCKWKNLVTRYKGCETMEPEGMRQQFPYYNELQAIFTARMQRMLWMEAEGGGASGLKKKGVALSSDDEDDNEDGGYQEEKEGNANGDGVDKGYEAREEERRLKETLEMEDGEERRGKGG